MQNPIITEFIKKQVYYASVCVIQHHTLCESNVTEGESRDYRQRLFLRYGQQYLASSPCREPQRKRGRRERLKKEPQTIMRDADGPLSGH